MFDMAKAKLPAEERRKAIDRFTEAMGRFYEESGVPRIGGRMLALLITAEQPLSAEQFAERLHVSRSSISANLKLLLARGSVEPFTIPGNRLTYYSFSWATWEQRILLILQSFSRMEGILRTVMEELGPDDSARERLVEYEHWVRFFIESYEGMRKNWPKRDRGKTEVSHG
jgi:DNA-binding transcriptional regulator GbsR (MarR family)